MEENNPLQFIEAFKNKNRLKFVKSFLEILSENEIEYFKNVIQDEELYDDLMKIIEFHNTNFKSKTLSDYVVKIKENLESKLDKIPKFNNEKKTSEFLLFIYNLYQKDIIPRQKLIQKKDIVEEFHVDSDTFNEWLKYFNKKHFIGKREFTSKEYAEMMSDLVKVEGLDIENIKKYHFQSYNKITIAQIVGDLSKSTKTNYKKLIEKTENLDDIANTKFINWIETHNKLPFSLAYQWIELLISLKDNKEKINTLDIFDEYFTRIK